MKKNFEFCTKFLIMFISLCFLINVRFVFSAGHENDHDHHHDEHHHGEHDHDEHKSSQKAHVHGYATMSIVLEKNSLLMDLDSPSANIVGFEHKASTKNQIKAVNKAKLDLESAEKIFEFIGTNCVSKTVAVDVSGVDNKHEEEHDHDHNHSNNSEEIHSDIKANYKFNCGDGKKLKSIKINLFDMFAGIEKLKVNWINSKKQGSVNLSNKLNEVDIK